MTTNPYESPVASGPSTYPVSAEKPVAGIVFGILNLVFGVMGICMIGFSSLMFFIPVDAEMMKQNPALQLLHENQIYKVFTQVSFGLGIVIAIVQIVAGFGLVLVKPYGRTLSLVVGWYGIVSTLLTAALNAFIVFPGLIENMNNAPPGPAQFGAIGGIIGGVIGLLIAPIYPGLLLYFMYRPKIIASYRGS